MTEQQAKDLIACLTYDEKLLLNEMLKAIEERRVSTQNNTTEV